MGGREIKSCPHLTTEKTGASFKTLAQGLTQHWAIWTAIIHPFPQLAKKQALRGGGGEAGDASLVD